LWVQNLPKLILSTTPSEWNSVHRPVRYVLDFYTQPLSITFDISGKARFRLLGVPLTALEVGKFIYIDSGIYEGLHKVTAVVNTQTCDTSSNYISGQVTGTVSIIQIPSFSFYVGYRTGEAYPTQLPEKLVATFTPERNASNQVQIDVSGYLKSQFAISRPVRNGKDFAMFNQFRLMMSYTAAQIQTTWKGVVPTPPYKAINSAIKSNELNEIIAANRYLSGVRSPSLFTCGSTILSKVIGDAVENVTYTGAVPSGSDYNNDFNSDYGG
jgi:hypothetical protein